MPISKQKIEAKILLNPASGGGNVKERMAQLQHMFPDLTHSIFITNSEKDLYEKAVDFAKTKCPLYISGGDGTLVIVLNALIDNQLNTPLLFLGTGSSNDIALHLGIKQLEAARNSLSHKPCKVDIGKIDTADNRTHFLGQVNLGLGAFVNHFVEQKKKKYSLAYRFQEVVGFFAIVKAFLFNSASIYAKLDIELCSPLKPEVLLNLKTLQLDKKSLIIKDHFDIILMANIKYWAGGKIFNSRGSIIDEQLNLILIQKGKFFRMLRILLAAGKGNIESYLKPGTGVFSIPFRKAVISTEKKFLIQADGELLSDQNGSKYFDKLEVSVANQKVDFYRNIEIEI
ncbi:MAG: hypothetical protein KDK38_01550 [Leptospiraceae bacterium]|nr:hypothetical protein [Leptospiraceae bacterium]